MTDLPTAEEIDLAELLGSDAGERGLPASACPWPMAPAGRERALRWRWRNARAGASSDEIFFGATDEP